MKLPEDFFFNFLILSLIIIVSLFIAAGLINGLTDTTVAEINAVVIDKTYSPPYKSKGWVPESFYLRVRFVDDGFQYIMTVRCDRWEYKNKIIGGEIVIYKNAGLIDRWFKDYKYEREKK